MEPLLVLLHSPLVGPFTWEPVAELLRTQGHEVLVPCVVSNEKERIPCWEQYALGVQQALGSFSADRPLVLVGHSGAGPLLPAINMLSGRTCAAYLFMDAGLPHGGLSQLAKMEQTLPELGQQLRAQLQAGGCYPTWSDADLRELIPERQARMKLLAELQPRGLTFFTEPLPIVEEWPDAPCGYIQLSQAYASQCEQARRKGWACSTFDAGHFHMLVEPEQVASRLIEMLKLLTSVS